MNARDLLADLANTGVSVTAAGDALVVRPASRLTADMRCRLRAAKPDVLAILRSRDAVPDVPNTAFKRETLDPEWWRDLFKERAAIREHDGGASRAEVEAGALADLTARWRAMHPLPASTDAACVHCGGPDACTPVLAKGGGAWLHRECWAPMNASRQAQALAAVKAMLGDAP